MEKRKLLIAIDGNSLMHRAYYALPPMTSRDGAPTGAVFGFLSMLLKLVERQPDYLVAAFDMHGPTFRHAQFEAYKAGRRETPDDLRPQFPLLQEILRNMGILVSTCESYEADDLLGTYARMAENEDVDALLVTGDRDALQLISDRTHVLLTIKGLSETKEMDKNALQAEYGLSPASMCDLKGLMGDSADNIPGIPGVGEKTALKLLREYGSLEGVLSHAGDIKGKLGEKINEHAGLARMSYKLGIINTAAPIAQTLADSVFSPHTLAGARPILLQYQLNAITKRLPEGKEGISAAPAEASKTHTIQIKEILALQEVTEAAAQAKCLSMCIQEEALLLSLQVGKEYRVSFAGTLLEPGLDPAQVFAALRPVLMEESIQKCVFDAKWWMHLLHSYQMELRGLDFDAMIVDYMLNALRPAASFEALCMERLGERPGAGVLLRLRTDMMQALSNKALTTLYETVERPLIGVLFRMEQQGFYVDTGVLEELNTQFSERIRALAEEIYALAGEEFSILSTKQLGQLLFEKLGLPTQRKTKTGYSTDSEALEALVELHPIVALVQEYRFLTKLKSTFVDGLLAAIDPRDGRVHTTFNQNITATGRISSTEPNLQNIPTRTALGREIRKAFVASEGNVLLGADYSQIELRLLAHISGDEAMIEAFHSGGDIHTKTAGEVFGVPFDAVTSEQRSAAKAVNFGIVYGISDFGLSRNLGITRKQAGEYIQTYLDRYPKVRAFMQKCVQEGKENGYVTTLLGRRRDLPEMKSGQYHTRAFGERVAMNMPIQGSAADIIKLAMIQVDERLRQRGLKARLALQVHDELLLEVPLEEQEECAKLVCDCMQNALPLCVPLLAEVCAGHSWYDTK